MPLKDFNNTSESIYNNERKYPDFFRLVSPFLYLKLSSVRKFIGSTNQALRAGNNFVSIRNRSGVRSHFKRLACGILRVGYIT